MGSILERFSAAACTLLARQILCGFREPRRRGSRDQFPPGTAALLFKSRILEVRVCLAGQVSESTPDSNDFPGAGAGTPLQRAARDDPRRMAEWGWLTHISPRPPKSEVHLRTRLPFLPRGRKDTCRVFPMCPRPPGVSTDLPSLCVPSSWHH